MTDDNWQPCWNVRPTATMPFTIWPFFYPFCGLYSTNDGYQQEQLWRYLKLMLVVLCHLYVIEMVLLASWYWFHVNDKDQQPLYGSESVVAILLALGSFLLPLWTQYYMSDGYQQNMDDGNQQMRYYLRCTITVLSWLLSFSPAIWCWLYMDVDNQQLRFYLGPSIGVLPIRLTGFL